MLKVDNKGIIQKISTRSLKQNITTNRIVVLAVILMTFMFTTVFTIGISIAQNMNTMLIRQEGNIARTIISHPTDGLIEQVKKCSSLYHAGISVNAGQAKPISGEDFTINLIYNDEENYKYNLKPALSDIHGTYPKKADEIMVSKKGLEQLGIRNPQIGSAITLLVDENQTTFTLSGWFQDYGFRTNNYDSYISENYLNKLGKTAASDGTLYLSSKRFMERKLLDEIDKITLNTDQTITASESSDTTIFVAAIVLFLSLVIVISGYLLIYNIMYISVNHNIRFYGMLKTIGTTSRQIRKIVRTQALRISVYGIPIGILLGVAVSFAGMPFVVKTFSSAIYTAMPSTISFNPLIFIGTIIFAVLTILISCRKPAKFAGNITPVEALNYTGIKGERTKSYHSDDGGKLHKMAYRNIFREKKQSFVVILSLLIGIIALLATQSFLKSMDLSNYANSYFPDDLTLSINVTDNDDFKKTDENKAEASNKLLKDIEKIEDVTVFSGIQGNIDVVYDRETFMPFFQEGNDSYPDEASTADNLADVIEKENLFSVPVTGLDEEFIERYNEQAEKPIDIEKFRNGEICFIGDFINDTYRKEMIGKTITLKNTETGKTKTIGIGASLSINDYFFPDGSNWETVGVPQRVYVSKNVIEELSDRTWVKEIVVDCDKENEPSVRDLIKSLTQNNICIPSKAYVEIKSEMLEEFQSSILSMRILTAGISIVLMLIGIVNFINVMFVGLYARRNELAMMESIGMTKQQIYKMLVYEGLYYTGIITFFILTVGNLITYLSSKVAQKIADYTCYPDPELKTLTIDVGFYISHYIVDEKSEEGTGEKDTAADSDSAAKKRYWIYSPGDGAENWDEFYDAGIMSIGWEALGNLRTFHNKDEMAKKMREVFSDDSSHKNDVHATWQFANEINPGDIVFAKKGLRLLVGCGVVESDYIFDEHEERLKNVRKVRWTHKGEWQYPGNAPMKTLTDLTPYPDVVRRLLNLIDGLPDEPVSDDKDAPGYWWLNANPKIWSFSGIAVGETQSYTLYNENGNKRRIFQNFLDAKAGDMIIGYESNPVKQVVALGQITAANDGEKILFEKVESFASPIDYAVLKACPELEQMEYFQNAQGSLFRLTKEEYDFILDIVREANPISVEETIEEYTKDDFLKEVFMTEKRYENLVAVLQNKKNIILQGAPGVGKTFAARRLAWSMMGEKDDNRIEFVQFHQNYSYEDFIMGYKPVEDGFELKYGVFYRFCQKAANQPDKDFFFIIDEINRGNMSKIFGELLMLIERDYRGTKATLAYNGLSFAVPKNLYIIGMMNTADRSLAMIDYALRRRFSFFEVEPGFDSDGFINYQNALNNETLNELIEKVKELNKEIARDKSLGKGFCIGHSYFCGRDVCSDEWLHSIVDYDILPMLSEYWFDDTAKIQTWENVLQGVFQ